MPALLIACKGTALGTASEPGPGQSIAEAVARVGPGYWALALTADGKTLASGGEPNSLRLWDLSGAEPKERGTLKGHTARVLALAFAPDGRHVATAHANGTVYVFRLAPAPAQAAAP